MSLPVVACKGIRSYPTMRDAWEAVQTDRSFITPVPFRCSTCRWWHVSGPEVRDRRHRVRIVEAA